jgi:hypothetical protein
LAAPAEPSHFPPLKVCYIWHLTILKFLCTCTLSFNCHVPSIELLLMKKKFIIKCSLLLDVHVKRCLGSFLLPFFFSETPFMYPLIFACYPAAPADAYFLLSLSLQVI